jgi:succinate dehydrogenase hydrophobic anchor subunit
MSKNSNTTTTTTSSTHTNQNSSFSPLQGDAGNIATHIHHKMTTFLAVITPLYFFAPESIIPSNEESTLNKVLGTLIAVNVSAHSWIGMNYVVTDYVPKVNKAMVGPARAIVAAMSGVTLLGLTKLALLEKGGIRGSILALWKPKQPKQQQQQQSAETH